MPNWCFNQGTISGKKTDVRHFIKAALSNDTDVENMTTDDFIALIIGKKFAFSNWLPMPQTYKDFDTTNYPEKFPDNVKVQQETYGAVGWYEWQVVNYGCKWDCEFDTFSYSENGDNATIEFSLVTPWSPPIKFFSNIQHKFPKLHFELEFIEPGMGFAGHGETMVEFDDIVTFIAVEYDDIYESPLYEEPDFYEDDEEIY